MAYPEGAGVVTSGFLKRARVLIRCRRDSRLELVIPGLVETDVIVVLEDGSEHLVDVERVTWDSGDANGYAKAVMTVAGVELDVEAVAEKVRSNRSAGRCAWLFPDGARCQLDRHGEHTPHAHFPEPCKARGGCSVCGTATP